MIHILIFVSWKQGPACWLVIAPYLFYGMAIAAYLLIPAALTFYTYEVWSDIIESPFFLQIFVSLI